MNTRIMRNGITALIGFLLLSPWVVMAQAPSAESMEIVREKLRADKKFFISQNMELTEAEEKVFWPT